MYYSIYIGSSRCYWGFLGYLGYSYRVWARLGKNSTECRSVLRIV